MTARAVIFGCEGPVLSAGERAFFAEADPWGFIVFGRNIETPDQLRGLVADLRAAVGRDAPVLVDQEGGRVERLTAPHWRAWPPARDFCSKAGAHLHEAMYLRGRLIAADLQSVGLDVNCAPILDVAGAQTHEIIDNRCYAETAGRVAEAGRALAEGQLAGGVLSIIKHIPGHGRATVDSHLGLPRVSTGIETLDAVDFAPFRALADLPMAMTAHIIYEALDPANCATQSPAVIDMIRRQIGFDGLLMTDDLSMKALTGSFGERASAAIAAGCDVVLHCNGLRAEMEPIAAHTRRLDGPAARRADAALALRGGTDGFDRDRAEARLSEIMGG